MQKKLITKFELSPSALDAFEKCPMLWAYKYLFKPKVIKKPQRFFALGNAIHLLMQHFYMRHADAKWQKSWLIDNWPDCYKYNFNKANLPISTSEIKLTVDHLGWLYDTLKGNDWLRPAAIINGQPGVEYSFRFPYNGHAKYIVNIIGKIDLLVQVAGRLHVIDWKTGSNEKYKVTDLSTSLQLLIYSAALKKLADVNDEQLFLVYVYLKDVLDFTVSDELFHIIVERVNAVIDAYAVQEYARKKGKHCNFCEYKAICKAEQHQRI